MANDNELKPTLPTIDYGMTRQELSTLRRSAAQLGKKQSLETKEKREVTRRITVATRTNEQKAVISANMSAAQSGKTLTKEHIEHCRDAARKDWDRKREEGFKHKVVECSTCGTPTGTRRWHFDHCKFNDKATFNAYEIAFLAGPLPNLNNVCSWQETAREYKLDSRTLIKFVEHVRAFILSKGVSP